MITNSAFGASSFPNRIRSSPSYPGIRISVITISGWISFIFSSASIPFSATAATSIPSASQSTSFSISWHTLLSSSAISTLSIRNSPLFPPKVVWFHCTPPDMFPSTDTISPNPTKMQQLHTSDQGYAAVLLFADIIYIYPDFLFHDHRRSSHILRVHVHPTVHFYLITIPGKRHMIPERHLRESPLHHQHVR